MKFRAWRILILLLVSLPIVHAASCGQGSKSNESNNKNNKSDNVNQASVATTVRSPQEQINLTSNQAPAPRDVPQGIEPNDFGAGIPSDPILSQLPYYCDPRFYAPNIIQNNRACQRFQPIPYIGFGQDHEPPIAPVVPIDYRLKRHVGRVDRDDDDDFHHHRRHRSHGH